MSRKVKLIRLHQSAHVVGIGELGNTLPGKKSLPTLKMETSPEGVVCECKEASFIVPWGNIIIATIEPEQPAAAVQSKFTVSTVNAA